MRFFFFLGYFIFFVTAQKAQPLSSDVQNAIGKITGQNITKHARILSSAVYNGRETGSNGGRLAASYIATKFRHAGLFPAGSADTFYQAFKFKSGDRLASRMEIKMPYGKWIFVQKKDYMPIVLPKKRIKISTSCVFAGYGTPDAYQKIDAKNKVVIVFSGMPDTYSKHNIVGSLQYKIHHAQKHGVVCLLVVENRNSWRNVLQTPESFNVFDKNIPLKSNIPVIHIATKTLKKIAPMTLKSPKPIDLSLPFYFKSSIAGGASIGRNVIGIFPGSDPHLKKEVVIIGAHYDHLGNNLVSIYPGANDNAAGIGSLINIAHAFNALPKSPKRTIVFIAFDGEEIGRLGSSFYITDAICPIKKIVLMINFDMIGRNHPNHIFAVGTRSSSQLHQIHHQANKHIRLQIENPKSFRLGRSDHTAFYYMNIPIMYLFGGIDPDYHSPRDTWNKLKPGKLEKVAKLAFLTALEVAQRKKRIEFNKKNIDD